MLSRCFPYLKMRSTMSQCEKPSHSRNSCRLPRIQKISHSPTEGILRGPVLEWGFCTTSPGLWKRPALRLLKVRARSELSQHPAGAHVYLYTYTYIHVYTYIRARVYVRLSKLLVCRNGHRKFGRSPSLHTCFHVWLFQGIALTYAQLRVWKTGRRAG